MSYVYGIIKAIATTIEGLTPDETSLSDTASRFDLPDAFVWDDANPAPDSADGIRGDCPDRVFWLTYETQTLDLVAGTSTAALSDVTLSLAVAYAGSNDVRPIMAGVAADDALRIQHKLFVAFAERLVTWPSGVRVYGLRVEDPRLEFSQSSDFMLLTASVVVRYQRTIS